MFLVLVDWLRLICLFYCHCVELDRSFNIKFVFGLIFQIFTNVWFCVLHDLLLANSDYRGCLRASTWDFLWNGAALTRAAGDVCAFHFPDFTLERML